MIIEKNISLGDVIKVIKEGEVYTTSQHLADKLMLTKYKDGRYNTKNGQTGYICAIKCEGEYDSLFGVEINGEQYVVNDRFFKIVKLLKDYE